MATLEEQMAATQNANEQVRNDLQVSNARIWQLKTLVTEGHIKVNRFEEVIEQQKRQTSENQNSIADNAAGGRLQARPLPRVKPGDTWRGIEKVLWHFGGG